MSGGSWGYAYADVERLADRLQGRDQSIDRRALGAHLHKVAAALKAIEWVDSGDDDEEVEAIRAVVSPADRLEVATDAARVALADLREVLDAR